MFRLAGSRQLLKLEAYIAGSANRKLSVAGGSNAHSINFTSLFSQAHFKKTLDP